MSGDENCFEPMHTDWELSPYTGMDREAWIEAAEFLLDGIFRHVPDMDSPIILPRRETEITYPHRNAPEAVREAEEKAEIFEGIARSFLIAAPLIHENPEIISSGISLRDYYKNMILRLCTSGDKCFAGNYKSLCENISEDDPFHAFQQTVETCALVIGMWACRDEIWCGYEKNERDLIADFVSGFAHGNTVPQNWRLFNMLDLAFLHMEGYPIDEEIMLDHAQAILGYYAGDGWYRDGQSFDYYSCWAFQFYAPLWCQWYGYDNMPKIAEKFEEHSNKLMESYADFFGRDGEVNMWGRSCIYRFAAVSAFCGNFFLKNSKANLGRARRISSGALLQFMRRDDFLNDGVPAMGFYGQFMPLVQGYSCAESPLWLGKAFMLLLLPAGHPFWTAIEDDGEWNEPEVREKVLDGPGLCVTNHPATGETVLRTGKVKKASGDIHGMWNYSKLSYSTGFPWESTPQFSEDGISVYCGEKNDLATEAKNHKISETLATGDIESQQYVIRDLTQGYRSLANATFWAGQRGGVLYRRQFFDFTAEQEAHWMQAVDLADFPVERGIFRVDRLRLFRRPVIVTLGSFGFPDNGTEIKFIESKDKTFQAVVLKGENHMGKKIRLAMSIFYGFSEIGTAKSTGSNPDSENSVVIYAAAEFKKQYGGREPVLLISQQITGTGWEDFSDDELFPANKIGFSDEGENGAFGNIRISLKTGEERTINFEGIDGRLTL
ncbi:MAG: DUF2264 domain-containing protein [Clostridiales bacterium]|nr:DUF2264 domain-containing protein [Clostridiales bacterium]